MAFLVQDNLNADDCTSMILSMWFELPEQLPTKQGSLDAESTGGDDVFEPPTSGSEEVTGVTTDKPEDATQHTYLLMEWGGYKQTSATRRRETGYEMKILMGVDDPLPFDDPSQLGWQTFTDNQNHQIRRYYWQPGHPLYGLDIPYTNVYTPEGKGPWLGFPFIGTVPPINVDKVDAEFGWWHYDPGGDPNDSGSWVNFTGANVYPFWGESLPLPLSGLYSQAFGPPTYDLTIDNPLNYTWAEFWSAKFEEVGTYWGYDSASYVAITGTAKRLTLSVSIGGPVFGPVGAFTERIGLGGYSFPNPGYTIIPRLSAAAPSSSPFAVDEPEVGGPLRPYVTKGKWHHLLVCADLKGGDIIEEFTPVPASGSAARYRAVAFHMLLDGVPYGGDPWPTPLPDEFGDPYPQIDFSANHESAEYSIADWYIDGFKDLQDTSQAGRHGILVKGVNISLPYFKKWERTDPDTFMEQTEGVFSGLSVSAAGLYAGHRYPYPNGWHGGDVGKKIADAITTRLTKTNAISGVVPAMQKDAFVYTDLSGQQGSDVGYQPPARTVDIKRRYSDVQIWFGKFIDPTDPNNLKLFLEITRDDEGKLVGNIPPLDAAALAAYAAAQADDPSVKVLSLAAAPNHLGKPDVYLAGGASSFIHDKGKEGDVMVKTGTINNTQGPSDIPIPESAVKPIGL